MTSSMRITGILLKNYRQFRNFNLDLTDPVTKEPLDKVCFIGSNGTGKSTLLELLADLLESFYAPKGQTKGIVYNQLAAFRIQVKSEGFFILNRYFYHMEPNKVPIPSCKIYLFRLDISESSQWKELWDPETDHSRSKVLLDSLQQSNISKSKRSLSVFKEMGLGNFAEDLAIYAKPDGSSLIADVPKTNLSNASSFVKNFKAYHESSYDKLENFWNVLIYQIKKRESDYQQFLSLSEVQTMPVAQARETFEEQNPEVLEELAKHTFDVNVEAGGVYDIKVSSPLIPEQSYNSMPEITVTAAAGEPVAAAIQLPSFNVAVTELLHLPLMFQP